MEFKRFSKDKQEQIRQFGSYAQMMGLTGKDIRSIGDKLDRMAKVAQRTANREIVAGYECIPVGDDKRAKNHGKTYLNQVLDRRFNLKNARGTYRFVSNWDCWYIFSLSTKTKLNYKGDWFEHELGDVSYERRQRYGVLLDINSGKLVLDF
jgi:hypothetical protein